MSSESESSPDADQVQYARPSELCAVLLSTIAWFCVILLAFRELQAIFKKCSDTSSPKRKVRRWGLLCYVAAMVGMSTAALVEYVLSFRCRLISLNCMGMRNLLGEVVFVFPPLPLAVFGADILMVWRCWVLYQGVQYILKIFINCLLTLFVLSSLALAFSSIALPVRQALLITAIAINTILSAMITCRLLVFDRGTQAKVLPFQKVLRICIESCVLTSICGLLLLATMLQSNLQIVIDSQGKMIFFALTTHISVTPPLLLVLRMANGRAHSPAMPSLAADGTEVPNMRTRHHRSIRFARPAATSATQISGASVDTGR